MQSCAFAMKVLNCRNSARSEQDQMGRSRRKSCFAESVLRKHDADVNDERRIENFVVGGPDVGAAALLAPRDLPRDVPAAHGRRAPAAFLGRARGSVEPGGQAGQINRVRQQISARLLVELAVRENQAHRLHGKPAVCQAHFVPQPTRNR